jgi:hypothetical protein
VASADRGSDTDQEQLQGNCQALHENSIPFIRYLSANGVAIDIAESSREDYAQ